MPERSRRAYHSPRREAAARDTRAAVIEAARREFAGVGYQQATLAGIARAAGVSLATVKLVEPSKAALLVAAVRAALRVEDDALPLDEQPAWRQLLSEEDPIALIRGFASLAASALDRQVDLLVVVWQAAAVDPEIARLEAIASLDRLGDVRQVVKAVASRGGLRRGLDVAEAAEEAWALASPQVFHLLVRRRGWPVERWARWLGDALVRSLIG